MWADQLITADPYGWLNVARNVEAQKRCKSMDLRSIRHRDRATLRFTSLFLFVKKKKKKKTGKNSEYTLSSTMFPLFS